MNEEQLGFDPTILMSEGKRYVEIMRNGEKERLIIDELMKRAPCVAGRATTCWKAHREGDESQKPLVIKDSWQYPERDEEGELLREATEKGVINVARYYHHETVRVNDKDDDIRDNVRRALDITRATNYKPEGSMIPLNTTRVQGGTRQSRSTSRKRSSSCTNAPLPPSKRTCSSSPTTGEMSPALKKGIVAHEQDFIETAEENFTEYYQPLIPWVNRLRKVVFLNGGRWEKDDRELYSWMKEILGEAQKDPKLSAKIG
jgi:hypothetical protein